MVHYWLYKIIWRKSHNSESRIPLSDSPFGENSFWAPHSPSSGPARVQITGISVFETWTWWPWHPNLHPASFWGYWIHWITKIQTLCISIPFPNIALVWDSLTTVYGNDNRQRHEFLCLVYRTGPSFPTFPVATSAWRYHIVTHWIRKDWW